MNKKKPTIKELVKRFKNAQKNKAVNIEKVLNKKFGDENLKQGRRS